MSAGKDGSRKKREVPKKSYTEEDSDEDSEFDDVVSRSTKKKGGGNMGMKRPNSASAGGSSKAEPASEELSEYELERMRNIQRNKMIMESLGLEKAAKAGNRSPAGKPPAPKKQRQKDEEVEWVKQPEVMKALDDDDEVEDEADSLSDDVVASDDNDQAGGGGRRATRKQTPRRKSAGEGKKKGGAAANTGEWYLQFNEREVAYAERLWPLLDVEGKGSITHQALRKVIADARTKGFTCDDDTIEGLFQGFAMENGIALTMLDITNVVSDSKMHYKK